MDRKLFIFAPFLTLIIVKDPCRPNPCLNNGECTHDDTTFTCICQPQFRGNKCEGNLPIFNCLGK